MSIIISMLVGIIAGLVTVSLEDKIGKWAWVVGGSIIVIYAVISVLIGGYVG